MHADSIIYMFLFHFVVPTLPSIFFWQLNSSLCLVHQKFNLSECHTHTFRQWIVYLLVVIVI